MSLPAGQETTVPPGWTRRRFVQGASLLAGAGWAAGPSAAQAAPPLPIPPLLEAGPGREVLELVAQTGRTEFLPGRASASAGYNGSYLGPTLRMKRGDDARIHVRNRLDEETTVHWHGLLIPAEVDGGPHNSIAPGASWRPVLPVRQAASTCWYHAHPHMRTAAQVYAGLAGMLIVTDPEEQALGLPSRYGIDDLPVVLQDKAFDREGRLFYPNSPMTAMHGMQGNVVLVNGAQRPAARVPRGLVRLRLLNGSNARIHDLAFDDGRPLQWIGTEGGLLRRSVALPRLSLAPGQRAEILVDFSSGGAVGLVDLVPSGGGTVRPWPLMRLEPTADLPAVKAALPARLAHWDTPATSRVAQRRRIVLSTGGMGMMGGGMGMGGGMRGGMGGGMAGMHTIDGKAFDMNRIDQQVRLGDVEIWEVRAQGMMALSHPFHVHGVHFEVLRRGGQEPVTEDQGRRDTVIVDEPVELLVHFTQRAAATAPFMYHCHILEHEDMGMMAQFTVA